jgi:hypothetical protein
VALALKMHELEQHNTPAPQFASRDDPPVYHTPTFKQRAASLRSENPPRVLSGVRSIGAGWISPLDRQWRDPGRAADIYVPDPLPQGLTMVYAGPLTTLNLPHLPPVTSPAKLYQNLLYSLSHRTRQPPSLRALINYHASFSSHLHSVRSYNFLIGLSIRHAAFGSAERLMDVMYKERIRGDLETWKLGVRWLVRSGRWEDGWNNVMRVIGRHSGDYQYPENAKVSDKRMPLAIWLEFLGSIKEGAYRERYSRRSPPTGENYPRAISPTESGRLAELTRYRLLMNNFPKLTPRESAGQSPRTIYLIVEMMLRTEQNGAAMDLTQSYLKSLPPQMDEKQAMACLDIIHLHIRYRFASISRGPFSTLRMTNSLLTLHPGLRPSSTTLFLLISGLRRRRRCATQATKLIKLLKRRWGNILEDRRVKRRVASLAAKEGRMDLLERVLEQDAVAGWSKWMWRVQKGALGGPESHIRRFRRWLRAKNGQLYRRVGRENWRWKVLRLRIQRVKRKSRWKSRDRLG